MRTEICYDMKALMPKLLMKGYVYGPIEISEEDEEWPSHKSQAYYFYKPSVKKVEYYYGFGTTATIELKDGRRIKGLGRNITSNVEHVSLDDNDYISPKLNINDNFVKSTDVLVNWLTKRGITMEDLNNCKQEFSIYETVEYYGVPTPSKSHGYWGYSSETLVMDEKEIETILNDIEDELLREKVKCILYARVFKHKR